MAKEKLRQFEVGTYPKLDIIKEYLSKKEYECVKRTGRFSGGSARRKLNTILDSLYEWEYDKWTKSYVIYNVLESENKKESYATDRISYLDIDDRCGELIVPLLLVDILNNKDAYERGLFENSLSDAIGFQNRNYSVYEWNRHFIGDFYGISPALRTKYNKYLFQRRKMMLNSALNKMQDVGLLQYENCWVSQKYRTNLFVKDGKYVVEEIKQPPQKALDYHIKKYKEFYNKLRKKYGVKKSVSPYSMKGAQKFRNELRDELFNIGICAFYKGVALNDIDENKIIKYLTQIGFEYDNKSFIGKYKRSSYKEIRGLLVDGYRRKKTNSESDVKNMEIYVETVIGEPFVPIERELEMNGINPEAVIKYNTKSNNVEIGKASIIRKEMVN